MCNNRHNTFKREIFKEAEFYNYKHRTAGSVLGTGIQTLLQDWDKILTAAGGLSLLALGVYTAKGVTGVSARYVESRLGKISWLLLLISIMFERYSQFRIVIIPLLFNYFKPVVRYSIVVIIFSILNN